jgi:hypothetical protein
MSERIVPNVQVLSTQAKRRCRVYMRSIRRLQVLPISNDLAPFMVQNIPKHVQFHVGSFNHLSSLPAHVIFFLCIQAQDADTR